MTLTGLSQEDLRQWENWREYDYHHVEERVKRSIKICEDELKKWEKILDRLTVYEIRDFFLFEETHRNIADIKTALENWRKIVE